MSVSTRAAGLGLAAGLIAGSFGVGGGIVIVPGLVLWLRLEQHRAHATSLTAVVGIATVALIPFAVAGEVDWPAAAAMAVGAVTGAYLGARLISRISPLYLARAFFVLLVVAAIRLFVS